jgi:hypothetical protein
MHNSRPLPLLALVLAVLGYTAVSATFNTLPRTFTAEKAHASSEAPPSGGSTGGGAGGSHNGGHRGHTTNVSRVVIQFLARLHQIGNTQEQTPRWHPYTAPLQENQKDFLCSLQRYFSRVGSEAINIHVLAEISVIMNYPADAVEVFLRNPLSCK